MRRILTAVSLTLMFCLPGLAQETPKKVKVFILAGQSNMEGKGSVLVMKHQLTVPEKKSRFAHFVDGDGWAKRNDVWISYLGARGTRQGPLTVGYGISKKDSTELFGPELGFGWTVGDYFDEPILLIKTAWGGKSIDRDFRPPSRGIPDSAKTVVANRTHNLKNAIKALSEKLEKGEAKDQAEEKKWTRDLANRKEELEQTSLEEYKKGYGHFYRQMIGEVKRVTENIGDVIPGYQDQGFEFAGFVWFQGWNDMYAPTSVEDYLDNMIGFIKDVRNDLAAPSLPFVIGAMGHNGEKQEGKIKLIADSQGMVPNAPGFAGNVVTVETKKYWDTEAEAAYEKYWADKKNRDIEKWREFGNDRGYHYLGSPVFFNEVGVGMGEAMLELISKQQKAKDRNVSK